MHSAASWGVVELRHHHSFVLGMDLVRSLWCPWYIPSELFSLIPRPSLGQTVPTECGCRHSSSHCVSFLGRFWSKESWSLPLRAVQCGRPPLTSRPRAERLKPETLAGNPAFPFTCKASGWLPCQPVTASFCPVHCMGSQFPMPRSFRGSPASASRLS